MTYIFFIFCNLKKFWKKNIFLKLTIIIRIGLDTDSPEFDDIFVANPAHHRGLFRHFRQGFAEKFILFKMSEKLKLKKFQT